MHRLRKWPERTHDCSFYLSSARAVASLVHRYTNLKTHESTVPLVKRKGRGIYVYDESGKEYIEGLAVIPPRFAPLLGKDNQDIDAVELSWASFQRHTCRL